MDEELLSQRLQRIKDSTDRVRTVTGVTEGTIEEVADAAEKLTNLSDYFWDKFNPIPQGALSQDFPFWITLIKKLPKLVYTCKANDFKYAFYKCNAQTIDLSGFDTSACTSFECAFSNCRDLESIDVSALNTSNVTSLKQLFNQAYSIVEITGLTNWDVSKVKDFSTSFRDFKGTDLDFTGWDMSSATNVRSYLYSAKNLINLKFGYNLGKGFTIKTANYSDYTMSLEECKNLTRESLLTVLNGLYDLNLTYDVANGGTLYTQKLILHYNAYNRLTAEDKEIATAKGWTITY